ncbi:MAG: carbohydrate-binding protein [Verrucomicrobiota bacterium]
MQRREFRRGHLEPKARVASDASGGNIELRLGMTNGPLMGVLTVTSTGGWQTWTTLSTALTNASGVQNLVQKPFFGRVPAVGPGWRSSEGYAGIPNPNLTEGDLPAKWCVMRCVVVAPVTRRLCVLAALLTGGLGATVAAGEKPASPPQPELLTNLFQLRRCANQEPAVVQPFRIVADVCDVDCASGVLVLRDLSGVEFIRLDLQGRTIEPGARVCLEGKGCGFKPKSFGLALVPEMVVDNDGLHAMTVESGAAFLHAGVNPITVQWFNHTGAFGLSVEYEGPGLTRQRIPGSVLSRANTNPATSIANFSAGLDYRCYQGAWGNLPDFGKLHPVKTGIVTNFDLDVRTRNEAVGLEFNGFITIPRDGVYTFHVASDDGSRLFVGESSLDVRVLSKGSPPTAIEEVPPTDVKRKSRPWVTLEGMVDFVGGRGAGGELQIRVGSDEIRVDIFESGDFIPNFPPGTGVRVSGVYQDIITEDGLRVPGLLLISSWKDVRPAFASSERRSAMAMSDRATSNPSAFDTTSAPNGIPAIRTVEEIKMLPPDLARQELPVSIRGVVTALLFQSAVVQDSTKGIYVFLQDLDKSEPVKRGEFYQIDGVTGPGLFAPVIVARRITHLGSGQWPQPLHATWDQLVNGSLDTQYAEIDGVVTAVQDQNVLLLTESGKITLDLSDFRSEVLGGYVNALIRIRGCAFASFGEQTRELDPRSLRVFDGVVNVLHAAPRDLFDVPQKSIGALLFYDPKAASFRLLKVSGQIIYGRAGEYFLTDGTNGMHVTTRNSDRFATGELVDAVGFLDLGGPAAGLKEAVMRKTGLAPLPAPTRLDPNHLLAASCADTLVRVEATLMNDWVDGSEHVLELQSGFLGFRARINSRRQSIALPPPGSRLELTGVYVPQGNFASDGQVNGFDLLLYSPMGIRVLATPPWWTLTRVLTLAAVLAALLCAVLVWNKVLQRKVQERGRQLETEIRSRQGAELRHAAEVERSRIARDLHDELGTGLTEVTMLASAGLGEFRDMEKQDDRFHVIAEKARALVSGLDVIVWAIDPKHNSLQSFADYLGSYAEELLSKSSIVCRLRIPIECDAVILTGTARHSLFLAIKEALNNVIRHASATQVELQMTQVENRLEIVIADNGRGFDWNAIRRGNGLTNIRERLEALHGQCQIESQPGKGTTVKCAVPLPHDPS